MKDEITREEAILALNKIREEIIELHKQKQSLIQKKKELDNNADEITTEADDLLALAEKVRKESYSERRTILVKSCVVSILLMLILLLSLVTNYSFQITCVFLPPGIFLCINYDRKFSKKEKNFNKNYWNAMETVKELLILFNDVMAKAKVIDQQIGSISIQINEKENQVSFIARVIETLDHMKESNKEKEPVSVMTTMIENEDEFIKENKQVKVKTKK